LLGCVVVSFRPGTGSGTGYIARGLLSVAVTAKQSVPDAVVVAAVLRAAAARGRKIGRAMSIGGAHPDESGIAACFRLFEARFHVTAPPKISALIVRKIGQLDEPERRLATSY
jgi:hypothetical protein